MKHYSKLKENKISSKTIFKGIVGVKFDTVKLVNGHKATRLYLDHQGASAVLPVEGEYIYLVQQYRYPVGRVTLELPAGKREKSQTFLACARAELKQETGMRAKSLKHVLMFNPSNAFSNEELHLFIATGLTRGEDCPDEDEFIHTVRMPLAEALEKVSDNTIVDGKTVTALLLYAARRKKGI